VKIGIDATSLYRKITGIESYTLNLIKALLEYDCENEYVIFLRKQVHPEFLIDKKRVSFRICPVVNQVFCEQIWLPYVIAQEKLNLVHFPAFPPSPLICKPLVFTIHDAAMWRFPKKLSWKGRYYFLPLSNLAALKASRIITVSEFSKKEIGFFIKKSILNIQNCGESIDSIFNRRFKHETLVEIKKEKQLPDKFILSVNSLEPRKNIPNLLLAFRLLKECKPSFQHKLVLVGRKAWGKDSVFSEITRLKLDRDVIITGYIEPDSLPAVYQLADIFFYSSLYEGFGLPPLEAMASGVPVIASDIPALKEILGEAAFYVDAHSPENMAEALKNLLENKQLRSNMIQKGFEKSESYSWQRVTNRMISVYESIASQYNRFFLLQATINNLYFDEALKQIECLIKANEYNVIVTPNVDHLVRLEHDLDFKDVYDNAALVLADGIPILWAAKFLGTPLKEKISGSDLFPRLCQVAAQKGYKVFFLGGREGAADKAAKVLSSNYPGLQIVGIYAPSYGFEHNIAENEKIVCMIKLAKPDILFVGLGSPKQEKWIYKHKDQYQVPVSIGIGVSFEFVSGMVKRAPVWMQGVGLEWFWRLLMEPKRLWKRYLINDMKFFGLVLKQKLSRKIVKI